MIDCETDPSLCKTSAYVVPLPDSLGHWYCEGPTKEGCSTPKMHQAREYDKKCPLCRGDERYPAAKAERFLLSLLDSSQQKEYLGSGQFDFQVDNQKWSLLLGSGNNIVLLGEEPTMSAGKRCITWANPEDINPPAVDLMSQCYLLAKKNMDLLLEMVNDQDAPVFGLLPDWVIYDDSLFEASEAEREARLQNVSEGLESNRWSNWYMMQTAAEVVLREEV